MTDEIGPETRLLNEAKRLVSVGYWHMPDATERERSVALEAQGALLVMSVIHEMKGQMTPAHQLAGKLVSVELAQVLCGHMKHAIAEHHLNVLSVQDDVALNYVPQSTGTEMALQAKPHQVELAARIANVVSEAAAHGGCWPSTGPEAWCSRSIARQMAQAVLFLNARTADGSAASGIMAIALAGHLSKHVAQAITLGLQTDRLREPVHLPIFVESLASQAPPVSGSRGPNSGHDFTMSFGIDRNVRN